MTTDLAQSVIHLLQDQQGFITSNELARKLQVSYKTIQRVVSRINSGYGSNMITSEKGRGYKLDYERFLLSKLSGRSPGDHSLPAERQKALLKKLLLAAPSKLKVGQLAEDFFVSESVIQSDVSSLELWLRKYDLSITRVNRTLSIRGDEKNIRDALMEVILGLSKDTTMNFEAMTQGLAEHDTTFALKQVDVVAQFLKADLPYPYDVNLFSHIYVLISRIRKFVKLPIEDQDITRLKEKVHNYPDLFSVSEMVKRNLENYLGESISENEVYYLFQYLISARFTGTDFKTKAGTSAYTFSEALIELVSHDIQLPDDKPAMIEELVPHVAPMLNRLENNIRLPNALLKEIQGEYPNVYHSVLHATDILAKEYGLPEISADEVGFLSLYITKYMESSKKPKKAIVICTTGLGSSELISAKIRKDLPELEILDVISNLNLEESLAKHPDVDILISTINLPKQKQIPQVLVSAMFTGKDKDKVEEALRGR
ncbi:PRD domain-containing protein [Lacticaseibacillus paracasei]|uniref:BglG family transcription antiterminator n=1 Tax=Lacticaseibacillus paracasei TaxID=1597 RepID=UPI00287646A8|nr:PRD domain-containing protein [Lacticaseibacillus paracasei]MDS0490016.1 PRD domain-containing protein [Lacticaseibacillus paracasei]